jgi:lipopolysaccharide biosynthesis glycosyltransferase
MTVDAAYARPLAVALRSIQDSLGPGESVRAHVVTSGFDDRTQARVAAGLEAVDIEWVDAGGLELGDLPRIGRFPPIAFARFWVGDVVPPAVSRVVYLDVDLLVRRSVAELARSDLGAAAVGACLDMVTLRCGSPGGLGDCLARGIPPDREYLNAGVLVLDMERWRRQGLAGRLIEYVRRGRGPRLRRTDQDVLNACLEDAWSRLDLRWNVNPTVNLERCWATSFLPVPVLEEALREPWIVHFAGKRKPWDDPWIRTPWSEEWCRTSQRTRYPYRRPSAWARSLRGATRRLRAAARALRTRR